MMFVLIFKSNKKLLIDCVFSVKLHKKHTITARFVRIIVRNLCKQLIVSVYRGAGGSRTLVQTRKQFAFYMLIFS